MLQNKTIKKITGLLLALFLIAGQFFVEGASVQAAGKQKTLNITDLSLSVGQSQKLKVLNGKKVRWSSSKKTVASVSKKGVVKAKKKGKAVITAKAGKWKRKARITVKAKKKKDNSSGDNQNETKQPAETEKPVVTDRPDVTPLPTEKPTEEPSPTKKPEDDNGNTGVAENEKIPKKLQEIPADYYTDYETYESRTYEQKSRKLNKRAIVYLPYGYSENERYNVFYLMHGGWSNETTWLGTPERPGTFKNVIDHAVSDGKMKPFIIVCPTYNNESRSDSGDYTLAYGTLTVNYHNELMNDLIPAVEGTYSTYADNVTPEGIKASRDHRAFGGFSMGSVATWHTFLNCLDAFRYFMPSSGAIDSTGNRLDSFPAALELSKKGYNAFALIYRPGEQTACEDLARAVSFWEKHIK